MDSLTQIILGAAVGEIALGKKIGNRALIWGAIGGTIPDLDVLANTFMDPIEALAFHRSISHSLFFSVVGGAVFAWVVNQLYERQWHKTWPYKILIALVNAAIVISVAYGINILFKSDSGVQWWIMIITGAGALYLLWRLYKYYLIKDLESPQATFKEWYWLFFLALATHWILDCFTAFGTQIFQPFSDYRVALNNIAVVDPIYTIPFLICVILVAFVKRNTRKRKFYNWLGIGISSAYMLFTLVNKVYVDSVFDKALAHRNIQVEKCQCSPTIFNNILWSCTAKNNENIYSGQYSIFDSDPNFHYLNIIPLHDSIGVKLSAYKEYKTLEWFSKGYLAAFPTDSVIYLSDLRYGGMTDTINGPKDLIFNFKVKEENGKYVFTESREQPEGPISDLLLKFYKRIKGY
ncbi:MAG: metal-dependent hydrolase [Bacteroidota bacterium]|nr:metal-dependent hydrolase [Bacteroidota bacterium]